MKHGTKLFLLPNNVGAIKFYNMYSFRGKTFSNYVIGHSHLILKAVLVTLLIV